VVECCRELLVPVTVSVTVLAAEPKKPPLQPVIDAMNPRDSAPSSSALVNIGRLLSFMRSLRMRSNGTRSRAANHCG
jgi:hypothetical protein